MRCFTDEKCFILNNSETLSDEEKLSVKKVACRSSHNYQQFPNLEEIEMGVETRDVHVLQLSIKRAHFMGYGIKTTVSASPDCIITNGFGSPVIGAPHIRSPLLLFNLKDYPVRVGRESFKLEDCPHVLANPEFSGVHITQELLDRCVGDIEFSSENTFDDDVVIRARHVIIDVQGKFAQRIKSMATTITQGDVDESLIEGIVRR